MTNRNLNWRTEQGNYPFLLKPAGKDYLWGGSRLNDDFEKNIDMTPLAETWECSTHPDGPSVVASGCFEGKLLPDVLLEHPEFLGTHPSGGRNNGELPILIKLIDAKKDLSVQVHPSDDYAFRYENGQLGKTEMWYVLDATSDASLIYGFSRDVSPEEIRESIKTGCLDKYLQKVSVKKDDVFYIESGMVHALGAGALVAEIQESSNLTYRLYDYNREDKNGNLRELHIDKALEVANRKVSLTPRQPMRVLKYKRGCASELLCRCKYFEVERLLVNTERNHALVPFQTNSNSFRVLLCTKGCGMIFMQEDTYLPIFKGDCIFIPADSVPMRIHGRMQLLNVNC
jgi:mannose-6-phosphate isomerase